MDLGNFAGDPQPSKYPLLLTPTLYRAEQLSGSFQLGDGMPAFKEALPYWLEGFRHACLLDGGGTRFDALAAVTDKAGLTINTTGHRPFQRLQNMVDRRRDWLLGFLSYDLKNDIEALSSSLPDPIGMPLLHFFEPEILLRLEGDTVHIECDGRQPRLVLDSIFSLTGNIPRNGGIPAVELSPCESQGKYLEKIQAIREHIMAGDVYEVNYCTSFHAEGYECRPAALFNRLRHLAKAPFSAFYKWNDRYLLSGSPERFVKKEGRRLISQPIKGTAPRGGNPSEDRANRLALARSEKDRAENVMIVDLVRNDLAKSCKPGSVRVDELFGIYGFEQVWQMISTVSGELRDDARPIEALRGLFPMGSMTGAPKVMAMRLIEQYEETRRGLYSGSVGYISPEGDFDFNVVIRSILYHAAARHLSYHVGGAIVFDSDPAAEYEECLLKAELMRKALGGEKT